jgi:transcription antitermination protein NusB
MLQISRRYLRIKTMQALYRHAQDEDADLQTLEKNLTESFETIVTEYQTAIYVFYKTAEYVNTDVSVKAGKLMPGEKDKLLSVQLFFNPIVQNIHTDDEFFNSLRRKKIIPRIDEELYKTFYKNFYKSKPYQNYLHIEKPQLADDKKVLICLYRDVLLNNADFNLLMEDLFPSWETDKDLISFSLLDSIEKFEEEKSRIATNKLSDDTDIEFPKRLLTKCLIESDELKEQLSPCLQNWDMTRIALVDSVVMQMAVAEWLYFPAVPVKVTLNEYIDIAKQFSTPKSGDFVNGILDCVIKNLREADKIKKEGRGLVEN